MGHRPSSPVRSQRPQAVRHTLGSGPGSESGSDIFGFRFGPGTFIMKAAKMVHLSLAAAAVAAWTTVARAAVAICGTARTIGGAQTWAAYLRGLSKVALLSILLESVRVDKSGSEKEFVCPSQSAQKSKGLSDTFNLTSLTVRWPVIIFECGSEY